MDNLKEYKFKYKLINDFFYYNDIFFFGADNLVDDCIATTINNSGKDYSIFVFNSKLNSHKKYKKAEIIANQAIKQFRKNETNILYLKERFDLDKDFFLSKIIDIKVKKLDKRTRLNLIVYNYFKLKGFIKKIGFDKFYLQYINTQDNEILDNVFKKMRRGIIDSIEDYVFICFFKRIICIYSKEVDNKLDYNNPSFNNGMILKYLENYFNKFAVIIYDEKKVEKFILKYYITKVQSEDLNFTFITNFINFYKDVFDKNLSFERNLEYDLGKNIIFHRRRAIKLNNINFCKNFDNIISNDIDYFNFMFILENFQLKVFGTSRKAIVDYISILELLLVKGDKNISKQIQSKAFELVKGKDYSEEEIKLIYDYRSKIIHGDYLKSLEKLHELAKMKPYIFTKKELDYEIYLNLDQMIEMRVKERLFKIVSIALKSYIMKNEYIRIIKEKY